MPMALWTIPRSSTTTAASLTEIYNASGTKTLETANNADGVTKDVFLFNFNGVTGRTTQHENSNAANVLQPFDATKVDGTHGCRGRRRRLDDPWRGLQRRVLEPRQARPPLLMISGQD